MYIPANPFESMRYLAYILLAISFGSLIWNRCHERNPYTKTWYAGFIGMNILLPVILIQSVQFNLENQSIFVDTGRIIRCYYMPLFAITAAVILFTGLIYLLPCMRQEETIPERKMLFWCTCLAVMALDLLVNWTLVHADLWLYFILSRPVRNVCLVYELGLLCLFFTERGWQNYCAKRFQQEGSVQE